MPFRIIGCSFESPSPSNGVWNPPQREMAGFDGGLVVFAKPVPKLLLDLGAFRKSRPGCDVLMVEQQPQFKTGVADGNLKTRLPRRQQGVQSRLKMCVPNVVISIEEDPKLVPSLDLPFLGDILEGNLEAVHHVSR